MLRPPTHRYLVAQARHRRGRLPAPPRGRHPGPRGLCPRDRLGLARPDLLRAGADRARRSPLPHAQAPHDGRRRGGAQGGARAPQRPAAAGLQDPRRPAHHARRAVPAGDEPRRAAAAAQRAARRHVARRAAADLVPGRLLRPLAHAPPRRRARDHRAVADRRAQRHDFDERLRLDVQYIRRRSLLFDLGSWRAPCSSCSGGRARERLSSTGTSRRTAPGTGPG